MIGVRRKYGAATLLAGLTVLAAACSSDLAQGVGARQQADGTIVLKTDTVYWDRSTITTGWNQLRAKAGDLCTAGYEEISRDEQVETRTCRHPCSRIGTRPIMMIRCTEA